VRLLLAGDVMTGRGIDQILPHPSDPRLDERGVESALDYVHLAEKAHGPIPRGAFFAYPWGDALAVLDRFAPDARIVNLETAVTRSEERWPGKEIHYRMHPENVPCLTAARIDCCVLANNHALDFGRAGLVETLDVLARANILTAGAGRDEREAWRPAVIETAGAGRVAVFGIGSDSSGIPASWAAGAERAGVALVEGAPEDLAARLAPSLQAVKRNGDLAVVSLHWGSNWGYAVPDRHVRCAHALIDAGADVVHGHSSHHPRPIEIHAGKLIVYGCGDLLNDYEGITGYEEYRGDLGLMYLASIDRESGRLDELQMAPMQVRSFRLRHASHDDAAWLCDVLDRESRRFGVKVELRPDHALLHASVTRGAVEPRPCARP
jgi:poly-gamma-glutamate synthesis protein (capsule biosynthesis protein)